MSRDYEILFIVRPDLEEDQVAEATRSVEALIQSFGGTTKKTDVWGRRKLAYEVRHLREGHYVLTDFEMETDRVPELEGALKISETVFRYLIVRKPEPKAPKAQESRGSGETESGEAQPAPAAESESEPVAAAEAAPEPEPAAEPS